MTLRKWKRVIFCKSNKHFRNYVYYTHKRFYGVKIRKSDNK